MKKITDIQVAGKKVLVRVDFNTPMNEDHTVADDLRIRMALPTLRHLIEHQAKVILCTHMGRPKGKRAEQYSLAPIAAHTASLLDQPVALAPDCIGPEVAAQVAALGNGAVLMLENLRFHPGEEANDANFSKQLAALADVYINDAFAVSHRAHASVVGVTEYVREKAAGFLVEKEMEYFQRAIEQPQRPLVAIVGGAKVSGKLEALENMLPRVDRLILGGAMANTFLKSQGYGLGASKVEDDLLQTADALLKRAREQGVKVYLPVDVVAADHFAAEAIRKNVTVQDIPEGWMALDIGPATVIYFQQALAEAKTIVWNGPMGAFEMAPFARGTMAMAHAVAASHALSVTGGGDSNAAIEQAGETAGISYMSTGGGAFLMLMEGKELPGIKAVN